MSDTEVDPNPSLSTAFLEQRAVALADEGVPIKAIARALHTPSDKIRDWIEAALSNGKLLEVPRDDWPPHTRMQRTPQFVKLLPEETRLFACMNLFKIPRTQAVLLLALLSRPYAPREYLHDALQHNRKSKEETSVKMIDVVLCNLRRKLRALNIEIETIWGVGYRLPETSRDAVNNALEAHVRGLVIPEAA
jgi:DNA-binding winged helix-turn-helix (wHTH) protein